MDKLGAELDWNHAIVLSVDSPADAITGFDDNYFNARRRKVPCRSQTCGAST